MVSQVDYRFRGWEGHATLLVQDCMGMSPPGANLLGLSVPESPDCSGIVRSTYYVVQVRPWKDGTLTAFGSCKKRTGKRGTTPFKGSSAPQPRRHDAPGLF